MEKKASFVLCKNAGLTSKHSINKDAISYVNELLVINKLFKKGKKIDIDTAKSTISNVLNYVYSNEKRLFDNILSVILYSGNDDEIQRVADSIIKLASSFGLLRKSEDFYDDLLTNNSEFLREYMRFIVLKNYFSEQLINADSYTCLKLSEQYREPGNIDELLKIANLDVEKIKENPVHADNMRLHILGALQNKIKFSSSTLCWENCANARTNKCPKVADRQKKPITEYPFVTDGYQVIRNGKLQSFCVTGCKHYELQTRKPMSYDQVMRLKKSLYEYSQSGDAFFRTMSGYPSGTRLG